MSHWIMQAIADAYAELQDAYERGQIDIARNDRVSEGTERMIHERKLLLELLQRRAERIPVYLLYPHWDDDEDG